MATIFCFTSTGNSLNVAKIIAGKIGGQIAPMRGERGEPVVCDDDVIGFVFPVYYWGLPRMVERFVEALRIENREAYVFSVVTYGGLTFGVHGQLERLLKPKGVDLRYGKNLKSVENYLPEFKVNDSEKLRRKSDEGANQIAEAIMRMERNRVYAPSFINRLGQKFLPDESSDRFFTVSTECTGCAICQKVCPADNITMDSGKPRFDGRCENCLGCLHACPATAIEWKDKTKGKARYRNAGVSLNELISLNNG